MACNRFLYERLQRLPLSPPVAARNMGRATQELYHSMPLSGRACSLEPAKEGLFSATSSVRARFLRFSFHNTLNGSDNQVSQAVDSQVSPGS